MKKGELRELYQMMFPEYPDIVTVKELPATPRSRCAGTSSRGWNC